MFGMPQLDISVVLAAYCLCVVTVAIYNAGITYIHIMYCVMSAEGADLAYNFVRLGAVPNHLID